MKEQKRHGYDTKAISVCNFHCIQPILRKSFIYEVFFSIYDLLLRNAFSSVILIMAIVAENDCVVVCVVIMVPINVMNSQDLVSANATDCTSIVCLSE